MYFLSDDGIAADENVAMGNSSLSGFWIFIRMVLVLAFVIAAIYFVFKLMQKSIEPGKSDDPFLKRVSNLPLGPGKSVQVITLVDKAFVIGVSDNNVNLIEKIDDKELVNAMNIYADKRDNSSRPKSFEEVLNIFMPSSAKTKGDESSGGKTARTSLFGIGKNGVFDSSTEEIIQSLKEKRLDSGDENDSQ